MGNRVFDVAELQRVYGTLRTNGESEQSHSEATLSDSNAAEKIDMLVQAHQREVALLREQIHLLERQLEDVRADRDKWQAQAGQITRLLTDESGQTDRARDELIRAKEEAAAARTRAEALEARLAERPSVPAVAPMAPPPPSLSQQLARLVGRMMPPPKEEKT
jgi:hypothetical protein